MKFNIEKINCAIVPKKYLKDKRLSLKAKGLLTIMYTLPEEWNYTIKGLCIVCNVGEKQIKGIFTELTQLGYLEITKERNELGQFEYIYNIFNEPKKTAFNQIFNI